ncbi:NAD(P)/FAD-dependent oxidoreductase [Sphingobium phenoxybenzoativorans]|uniref:NAD(P)/FAD-dependent oxidoreductase n=1 Tax=Sphingobium phenoxybenzoativorans TaxID=1592790 RepID=A0A975K500_9SPHN|nr:NAD(P)/FAD-dependent oxidoreductase [Sphingobium phenoxybenzoativorans]QUT04911.1 NAD(P)/FAD-dependent oxidoreductase [Sphingobium phenoxybenzoativorans]
MTEKVDVIIAGAGVVGLAVARALAMAGREVLILESEGAFGQGTSSRNSEVIHAGVFNAPGMLKSSLCVRGRQLLYRYCEERHIDHKKTGKLVVATDPEDLPQLDWIEDAASKQGLEPEAALYRLTAEEAKALEPNLRCAAAVMSPSTGVIDAHGYMTALLGDAEANGASLVLHSPVDHVILGEDGHLVSIGGSDPIKLKANLFVNSAGLSACALAARTQGYPAHLVPEARFVKGNYFTLTGKTPFTRPIYPLHQGGTSLHQGGHSLHITIGLDGRGKFGPDSEPVAQPEYEVDPARAEKFYDGIRKYWPGLPDGALEPGYAGVRPKIVSRDGAPVADFLVEGPGDHGIPGLVNLFGIESPGLTSSLAIAEMVAAKLAR